MGRDKATLPFGPELMLQRVVRLVGEVVEPANIVVVAAPDQALPDLPRDVQVAYDSTAYRGPLEGLATGLRALEGRAEAVYATACDVPLLVPEFVERMFELLGNHDIAVPYDGEFHHPLAAVYRSAILPKIEQLLAADRMRLIFLFDDADTRKVNVELVRSVDPELATLKNLNRPEDYEAALLVAGYDDRSN
jgi:molybdopterin-guanine dinucleotide biosynthesis protein A